MKPRSLQISISFLTSGILLLAVVSFIFFSFYSNKSPPTRWIRER